MEARIYHGAVGACGPRDSARLTANGVVYRGTRGGRVTPRATYFAQAVIWTMKSVASPVVVRAEVLSPLSPVEAGTRAWAVATPISEVRPVRKAAGPNCPCICIAVLLVLIAITALFLIIYR